MDDVGSRGKLNFLASIPDFEPELPAFEAHHHPSKLFPRNLPSVDHEHGESAIFIVIPSDAPAHQEIGNVQSRHVGFGPQVLLSKQAADPWDHLAHQLE
jgi:hypothetical protein